MTNGCTYNDELSCTGRKCISVDFNGDYGTDHFYSGKSVSCGISRVIYVRSSNFILRAYQKFLILICMFLFCFPVYAEDEAYEFQYIGNEALALQGEDVNQILYDQYIDDRNELIREILSYPLSNEFIEGNTFSINNIRTYSRQGYYGIRVDGNGDEYVVQNGMSLNINGELYASVPHNTYANFPASFSTGQYLNILYIKSNLTNETIPLNINVQIPFDESINNSSSLFLVNVKLVFTWIISHIGDLISFILANAFLSVSLLLFMCGAVISFFVRVKRS